MMFWRKFSCIKCVEQLRCTVCIEIGKAGNQGRAVLRFLYGELSMWLVDKGIPIGLRCI